MSSAAAQAEEAPTTESASGRKKRNQILTTLLCECIAPPTVVQSAVVIGCERHFASLFRWNTFQFLLDSAPFSMLLC